MRSLHLENIRKKFGRTEVLNGLDLTIPKGSICALTGESGSGKTTLLRIIAGLEACEHGKIFVGDVDVTQFDPEDRRIALVFQQLALFPHLTVDQNIGFGIQSGKRSSRLSELKAMVGLKQLGGRYPHELSGGQQQRVALARALGNDPDILLMDEPFSNLDEITKGHIRGELLSLIKDLGMTTIIVTHHPADAFMFSDHLVILQDGIILQEGSPEEIYSRPVSAYVSDYFGASVILKAKPGRGRIHTDFGDLLYKEELPESPFTLLMRPEHIRIETNGNGLFGRVKDRIFKGPHEILVLENRDGSQVLEFETERTGLKSGDEITLKPDLSKMTFLTS